MRRSAERCSPRVTGAGNSLAVWAVALLLLGFVLPANRVLREIVETRRGSSPVQLTVELEESAWVDGASRFDAFLRIALPLAAPAIAVSAVLCFAFSWNEFIFALILTYKKAQPVTVIIAGVEHTQGVQFWFVATRLLSAILPPAILVLTAQRHIVRGLTFGAVKG